MTCWKLITLKEEKTIEKLKHVRVSYMEVRAIPGSCINDCIREAVVMSIKEGRYITLIHNNYKCVIDGDQILTTILEIKEKRSFAKEETS